MAVGGVTVMPPDTDALAWRDLPVLWQEETEHRPRRGSVRASAHDTCAATSWSPEVENDDTVSTEPAHTGAPMKAWPRFER